jgi:hypothetical protein
MSAAGFPALGFDPAPGDVTAVQHETRRFAAVAQQMATTVRNLEQVDAGYWKGEAATAFVRHVHTTSPRCWRPCRTRSPGRPGR